MEGRSIEGSFFTRGAINQFENIVLSKVELEELNKIESVLLNNHLYRLVNQISSENGLWIKDAKVRMITENHFNQLILQATNQGCYAYSEVEENIRKIQSSCEEILKVKFSKRRHSNSIKILNCFLEILNERLTESHEDARRQNSTKKITIMDALRYREWSLKDPTESKEFYAYFVMVNNKDYSYFEELIKQDSYRI